jgi:hypothetical protein
MTPRCNRDTSMSLEARRRNISDGGGTLAATAGGKSERERERGACDESGGTSETVEGRSHKTIQRIQKIRIQREYKGERVEHECQSSFQRPG